MGLELIALDETEEVDPKNVPPELGDLVALATRSADGDVAYGTIHAYER